MTEKFDKLISYSNTSFSERACVEACIHLKLIDPSVNGVSLFTDPTRHSCWCEKKMRWIDQDHNIRTCHLKPRITSHTVDAATCNFTTGHGLEGSSFFLEKQTPGDCVMGCLHMKRADTSINGVSVNADSGECRCHTGMKKIGSKSQSCVMARNMSCVSFDVSYTGVVLANISESISWAQCREHCIQISQCEYWSWNAVEKLCQLRNTEAGRTNLDGWVSGGRICGGVECRLVDGEGLGGRKRYVSHETGEPCISRCAALQQIDHLINGVTIFNDGREKGCYCRYNMSDATTPPTHQSCFLTPQHFEPIEEMTDSPQCSFKQGDGTGVEGSDIYIGALSEKGCLKSCLHLKKVDPSVNGISVYKDPKTPACWCERNMEREQLNWSWWSYLRKSCMFVYNSTDDKNKAKNEIAKPGEKINGNKYGICTFSPGGGFGDLNRGWVRGTSVGVLSRDECYVRCYHKKQRGDHSINGVTWDRVSRICYCERNITGIGEYQTCVLGG